MSIPRGALGARGATRRDADARPRKRHPPPCVVSDVFSDQKRLLTDVSFSPRRYAETPQGAAAAGTFSSKGLIAGAYADGSESHKSSEEVEAYWMKQIESERASAAAQGRETNLPYGFDQREKTRAAEAKAYGAADAAGGARSAYGGATPGSGVPERTSAPTFAHSERHAAPDAAAAPFSTPSGSEGALVAEVALVRVATHTLETLTATLRAKPVPLDAEDRAAFAAAVKKSLDAVLHCR